MLGTKKDLENSPNITESYYETWKITSKHVVGCHPLCQVGFSEHYTHLFVQRVDKGGSMVIPFPPQMRL